MVPVRIFLHYFSLLDRTGLMPSDNSQVHPAGKDAVKRDYYGSTTVTKQKVRTNKIILTLIYTVCNLYTTRFG